MQEILAKTEKIGKFCVNLHNIFLKKLHFTDDYENFSPPFSPKAIENQSYQATTDEPVRMGIGVEFSYLHR